LLFGNLIDGSHDLAQRVDLLDLLVESLGVVFDVFGQNHQMVLGLAMEIISVVILPLSALVLQVVN
jgi:hypothetical protein